MQLWVGNVTLQAVSALLTHSSTQRNQRSADYHRTVLISKKNKNFNKNVDPFRSNAVCSQHRNYTNTLFPFRTNTM
jgi:hypothetical protein